MDLLAFKKKYVKIPDSSGVYFFLGKRKKFLYIGKATSLKQRVRSYFDFDIKEKRSALIEKMVSEAVSVEWTLTDSVLEAMLLETNLIRTHRPRYNTRSKDDKSFNHVVITKGDFPRVLIVRGKDLLDSKASGYSHVYGPFPSGVLFKDALKIIRKLFQYYDGEVKTDAHVSKMHKGKLDFNRQIGLYPESCTKKEYAKTIRHIQLFFEGKKKLIISDLVKQMNRLAKNEEFEEAHTLKKRIFALQHIQDVALLKNETRVYKDNKNQRIEAYDIAHLAGDDMVGVMTVMESGEILPSQYRKFNIKGFTSSHDVGALKEVLMRRLKHPEWTLPDLIVVDGSKAQKSAAESVLKKFNLTIAVVGVVKDEKHKPKSILGAQELVSVYKNEIFHANSESHRFAITFHRHKRNLKFKA